MFSLFPRPLDQHFIDNGRVGCPVRECDVESDSCVVCTRMIEIDEKAKMPFVRCRPVPRPLIPA